MKYALLFFLAAVTFCSCNQEKHHKLSKAEMAVRMDSLKNDLLQTDIKFSELSQQKGRNAAFIEYADSGATMLRPNSMPIMGKDSIVNMLALHPDSTHKLSWIPVYAGVARSGDLGYTYGTFVLDITGKGSMRGTYCTVWKKDKDHKWKFVLDTGNEGLSPEDEE
ncbi:MAG: hypothetical protein JWO06_3314 [Bacteroidota bacterium]|nr:hypothetical protein [Bacteroidota bacterium]